jgi:hypothetical protein
MKSNRTAAKWLAGAAIASALFVSLATPAQARTDDTGWDIQPPSRVLSDTGWD